MLFQAGGTIPSTCGGHDSIRGSHGCPTLRSLPASPRWHAMSSRPNCKCACPHCSFCIKGARAAGERCADCAGRKPGKRAAHAPADDPRAGICRVVNRTNPTCLMQNTGSVPRVIRKRISHTHFLFATGLLGTYQCPVHHFFRADDDPYVPSVGGPLIPMHVFKIPHLDSCI